MVRQSLAIAVAICLASGVAGAEPDGAESTASRRLPPYINLLLAAR